MSALESEEMTKRVLSAVVLWTVMTLANEAAAAPAEDAKIVAALDIKFQDAVKRNDAAVMRQILHPDMVLVLGDGQVITREQQLKAARNREISYEIQDEIPGTQSVRVWGRTAVVTARLRIKGIRAGLSFERELWFSDTYVRTDDGWKYLFGQASLPLR
jgi:ketosteroid isomerase-like protein